MKENKTQDEIRALAMQHIKPAICALAGADLITICVIKNNDTQDDAMAITATGGVSEEIILELLEGVLDVFRRDVGSRRSSTPTAES